MTLTEGGARTGAGIGFVDGLEEHGAADAVVDVDGTAWSYAALARRADEAAARLGATRRLVLLEAANDVETIAWYLGALRGGHAVLLAAPDDPRGADVVDAYDPDAVVGRVGDHASLVERRPGTAHELHPDLALLLSTSGSTGSPKLVRLSHANLDANARAIASYLHLGGEDRAITSLPLQYCYGLSVLHSHLAVGAGVVCTSASVVDSCFWRAVDRHGVTNLAGVPHTFDLLDRSGFPDRRHPTLRLLTQAGGRMAPDTVSRWAKLGLRAGFELFVMYGQTEATARMAYLPPTLAATCPDAVGVPVPGGSFRLEPVEGAAPDEGELVYTGPNVMLGYAESPSDLAVGATLHELRTGDIARIDDDGFVWIEGRSGDLINRGGNKVFPEAVEEVLRLSPAVDEAAVVGRPDDRLGEVPVAFLVGRPVPDAELEALCRAHLVAYKVPAAFHWIDALPRNEVGKLLRRELATRER